jgi:hypothetical protein
MNAVSHIPIIMHPLICLLRLVKDVRQVATSAVLAIVHGSHEDTSTALGLRALAPQALDLAVTVNLVVLENRELRLLPLVLDLLGGGVHLLLALLGSST